MKIKGKKLVIIGLSRSGEAAARLALNAQARVFVSEISDTDIMRRKALILRKQGIAVELGRHCVTFLEEADLLITSPGVKNNSLPILWAKRHKVAIISEIEFAGRFCTTPVAAITGSNGKTTVTTLLGKIVKASGRKTVVCGNIGIPFSREVFRCNRADNVILELSSFQLQYTDSFSPRVSVVLNITQNHFDHHRSMREYSRAKCNLVARQGAGDFAILNFSDKRVRGFSAKTKAKILFFSRRKKGFLCDPKNCFAACWLEGGNVVGHWKGVPQTFFPVDGLRHLAGMHNVENAMAAVLAAKAMGIGKEVYLPVLKRFRGIEHRCEPVAVKNGVAFVNDSKSTTVDATEKALLMFADRSVILICGGRNKGSDFRVLKELVRRKVYLLVCIGEAQKEIQAVLGRGMRTVVPRTLEKAVAVAYRRARPGTTVLLSPMCASFDMFDNYEHRGKVFKSIVKEL
ncbi:MAG: UDP-N-acetylmuramoyl-L-alanine--D-glutamate ligase [Candidatus Omnitrophica bacterium]|nr:UDP-N-acetylmuramoyl-L-alanine--D-glutamate ligase [Candidatus Omnitrophota bacterium]MBU4478003.1 UDP-N-acetylmuramoyl-L-alanine--D-glutamate ligase [Candidatus Omnitrophota bacterium]MCG2703936.1 UDP-N-acetylmuramoyl-L-alanine--D-glutamate ligase [Candidatus Omnitrophota bacterium]